MAEVMLEEVSRALLLTLKGGLSTHLAAVASEMAAEDTAFYAALGRPVPPTPLSEPITFEIGHHPSVTQLDLSLYPMLIVLCYGQESAQDIGSDQYETLAHGATAEIVVNHDDAGTVNRIAMRTAKALHRALLADRTLGGITVPVALSPSILVSQVTTRFKEQNNNEQTYVQACLLEYTFDIEQPW